MTNTDMNIDTTSQTITAQRGHIQALAFARKGGVALSTLLGNIATRKEQERKGPIEMVLFLETHFTDDEAVAIPVVGSKMGETGNKPFDKYTSEVQTKDGKKKVPGSWFTDVIRGTDEYTAAIQRKEWCDDVSLPGCPQEIIDMGTGERAAEKQRLNDRIKDMRTGLTRGAMLFHHAAEIRELNPERIKVKLPIRSRKNPATGEEYQEVYGNTVRLQDPAGEIEDKVLSVSQFNALRPAKLTGPKEGWTTSALETTADRAPKTKGGKGKQQTIPIPTTVEALLNMFNIISTALDIETEQGAKMNTLLLTACATPGAKGDDVVETTGDHILTVDGIWNVIDKRYNGIKAAKAQALNQRQVAAAS